MKTTRKEIKAKTDQGIALIEQVMHYDTSSEAMCEVPNLLFEPNQSLTLGIKSLNPQ